MPRPSLGVTHLVVFVVTFAITAFFYSQVFESRFHVYYSLDHRANDRELVRVIDNAQSYVYFAIYYISKSNIVDALIRAKKRGLVVWGITDAEASTDANRISIARLRAADIPVEVQKHQNGIMHMKVLVTDQAYASGSYNWTVAATNDNDDVLEIGTDSSVRSQYLNILKKVLITNQ